MLHPTTSSSDNNNNNNKIESIKLEFNASMLYGRRQEMETIHEIYETVLEEQCSNGANNDFVSTFEGSASAASSSLLQRQLIVFHGKAGVGKTALAETIRDLQELDDRVFFASGKCDVMGSGMTAAHGALAMACSQLCDLILKSPDRDMIGKRIREYMGRGAAVFQRYVPKLKKLLQTTTTSTSLRTMNNSQHSKDGSSHNNNNNSSIVDNVVTREEWGSERLKGLMSEFLRAVCGNSKLTPTAERKVVVLFIDDLQWADQGSIQLFRFLATDQVSDGLLLLASYRDDEVEEDAFLSQQLTMLQEEIHVTTIPVRDLDLHGVNELVASVTCRKEHETLPLASVMFDKTHGNVFFVVQFLKMIEEEGYLYFAAQSLRWEWDLENIDSEMRLADNVVELVAQKIQRLPAESQTALKIAACIGSTINARIVDYLSSHVHRFVTYDGLLNHGILQLFLAYDKDNAIKRQEAWMDVFDSLAEEGLVNKRKKGSDTYVWSHDRIMESAYSLVPSGDDRKWIHYQIGEALKRMDPCPLGERWKLTAATDQLNRASSVIGDDAERVELARMNLNAAKTVASISAFYQAAKYLKAGIELLDERTKWNRNYALSLELHSSLAEIEKYIGHHDACQHVVQEVLQQGKSLTDKFRCYLVLVESLGAQRENQQLVDLALSLSARLREPIPRKAGKVRIMFEVLRTQHLLGSRTDEEILGMPTITDERVHQALSLFSRLHRLTWNAGNIPLTLLIRLRMTQLILRHGCSEFSGPALALYGCILAKFGKLEQAYRFGVLAMKFIDRFPIEETQTSLYVNLNLQIIKKPLSHSLEPLLRTHRAGLEKGDIIFSGALAYCVFYFFQGLPLGPLQEDARSFAGLMTQYGNVASATFLNFYRQLALNLMGRSNNFVVLSGEAIDLEKVQREAMEKKNHVTMMFAWTTQSLLACFAGDEELAVAMYQKLEKVDLLPEYFPGGAIFGLMCAFLARSTGNRKYARRALKITKEVDGLLKKGSVNYLHFLFILKAELAALRGKVDAAANFYAAAIRAAAQTGFTNFEALAAERAGLFALERDSTETFWASTYLSRAVFLYADWGAVAKVDQLKQKYPTLITETGRGRRPSANLKGRRRFDQKLVDQHRDSAHKLVLRSSLTSETS
jgi:predicted ATPase